MTYEPFDHAATEVLRNPFPTAFRACAHGNSAQLVSPVTVVSVDCYRRRRRLRQLPATSAANVTAAVPGSGTGLLVSVVDDNEVVAVAVSAGRTIESIQLCSADTRDKKLPPGTFAVPSG